MVKIQRLFCIGESYFHFGLTNTETGPKCIIRNVLKSVSHILLYVLLFCYLLGVKLEAPWMILERRKNRNVGFGLYSCWLDDDTRFGLCLPILVHLWMWTSTYPSQERFIRNKTIVVLWVTAFLDQDVDLLALELLAERKKDVFEFS